MKRTGVTRPVDQLGRIVIPSELRRILGLDNGTVVEFLVDGNQLIVQKYATRCVMCGNDEDVLPIAGKPLCAKCTREISEAVM